MTLLLLCLLCAPPDALPDALPDSLPDAKSSGTPAPAAADVPLSHVVDVQPGPSKGATAAQPSAPPAPAALLDLWLTNNGWCGACPAAHRLLDELYAEGWPCQWVEFDEHRETAAKLGIHAIPTWQIVRAGKEVSRLSGVPSKAKVIEWLKLKGVVASARNWSVDKQAPNPVNTAPSAQGCAGGSCGTWRRGR